MSPSPSGASATRNPSKSIQSAAMRSCRSAVVHPPCSGWPSKARLLVSSHVSSSLPGFEGPGRQVPGGVDDGGGEGERDAHLQQIALGFEAQGLGQVVVLGPGPHGPQMHGGGVADLCHRELHEGEGQPAALAIIGVDDDVQPGRTVSSGEEERGTDELTADARHHGAPALSGGDGKALGLGQGRVVVGRRGTRQQVPQRGPLGIPEASNVDQFHAVGGVHAGQRNPVP